MRQVVKVLRAQDGSAAGALAPEGGIADLDAIVERVRSAGLAVTLEVPDLLPRLGPQVELAAVRIVQEALTNALVHAGARQARVTLSMRDSALMVTVDDDGTLGPPPATRVGLLPRPAPGERVGHGLVGMQERAAGCGGRVYLASGPLGGWRVIADLRLPRSVRPRAVRRRDLAG